MRPLSSYKLCPKCDQPILRKGQVRENANEYRHASGCPLDDWPKPKKFILGDRVKHPFGEGEITCTNPFGIMPAAENHFRSVLCDEVPPVEYDASGRRQTLFTDEQLEKI